MLEAAEQALAGARFCGELAQQVIGQGGLAALAVGGLDQPPGFVPAVAGGFVLGGEGALWPQHVASDLLGHQTPGGIAPVARGDLLAGRGGQRRIGIGQAQAPGVFQRGGAALRRDGRGAISRMLLCQALLGRQRARFQLGQNQTGGVVAIAGVAGIKAGLGHQAIERVVAEVIARAILVEQRLQTPGAVVLVAELAAFGIGAGDGQATRRWGGFLKIRCGQLDHCPLLLAKHHIWLNLIG